MEVANKHVLITGAGGFIGSHLVEELLRRNCKVTAFVHYNSFNRWGWLDFLPEETKSRITVFTGDIRDPNGVRNAMKGVEIVFHLAALIGIPYSYHSPDTYVDTNIKGTLNVLQAARDLAVQRIVHTSTSEVYGTAQFVPITELHPVNPQSPYAATKSGADFLALTFQRSFDLPVSVARPFNTYGPRQSARAIIPTVISQIAGGMKQIRLGDVTPTRDFTFVKDTCKGFINIAESDASIGEVVNIGSNFEISILETFKLIRSIMNSDVEFISENERIRPENSEVFRLWCDNGKINKLAGFVPDYSLDRGLRETIEWLSQSGNLTNYKPAIYNV